MLQMFSAGFAGFGIGFGVCYLVHRYIIKGALRSGQLWFGGFYHILLADRQWRVQDIMAKYDDVEDDRS